MAKVICLRPQQSPRWFGERLLSSLVLLSAWGIASNCSAIEHVWRWQPDPQLNQVRYGARGVWRGELWGLDWINSRIWSFDGQQFHEGGRMPGNQRPLISMFTDDGIFALSPNRENNLVTADIVYSPDGYQDFRVVVSVDSSTDGKAFALGQDHSMVDLGGGKLMFFQYSDESRVMYSSNAGQAWRLLFQPAPKSIRHFHGAFYDKEYGKLYAMSGDSDSASSVVVCDDLFGENGLINNPSLWRTRWGMDDVGRTTRDERYFLKPDGVPLSQRTAHGRDGSRW